MKVRATSLLALAALSAASLAQNPRMLQVPADALLDQAVAGDRLHASSAPTLGRLYPLSENLFVSPEGDVGIGTTGPIERLHVEGAVVLGKHHLALDPTASLLGGQSNSALGAAAAVVGGISNTADGVFSIALGGVDNRASGAYSVASGTSSRAEGSASFAAGRFSRALHNYSFVWNGSGLSPYESTGQAQFLINAPGGVGIGTNAPDTRLHVTGGSDASVTGGGYVQLGNTSGLNVVLDENEIMARSNGSAGQLFLNHDGGNVLIGAASTYRVGIGTASPADRLHVAGNVRCTNLIETSDARLKEQVEDLEDALETVLALRGVSYRWNDPELARQDPGERLGFLAQEVREVLPEAVSETEDGTLGVDYTAIVPVLVEALQAQDDRLRALEAAVFANGD